MKLLARYFLDFPFNIGVMPSKKYRIAPGYRPGKRADPPDYTMLLFNTNNLLTAAGITAKKIKTIGELTRVASSMFVAVYESLFHVRVEGIIRSPKSKEDYVSNVQKVIDGLSGQIQMDLQHIKGNLIVEGDVRSLSNLIHIFIRIIAITGSQESQSTRDEDQEDAIFEQAGIHHFDGGDGMDIDSISTHESTFVTIDNSRVSSQGKNEIDAVLCKFSPEKVRKMCEKDARQLLLTTEAQIKQNERAEAARLRRDNTIQAREVRCGNANRKREEVTKRMQQIRWLEECHRAADAYKLRQDNEEHTMLRQIYRGLLQKLFAWRRAERQEAKENVKRMGDDAMNYIKSLQVLFEDRVKILREKTTSQKNDSGIHERAQRRLGTELKRAYASDNQKVLETQNDILSQRRYAQLLKEREGHRHLLSLLSMEKWQDTLRE